MKKRLRIPALLLCVLLCPALHSATAQDRIDRRALVLRHHVLLEGTAREAPLSAGNGEFAFSVDATGLQTYPDSLAFPLLTQAQWAWHSFPNPEGYKLEDTYETFTFRGKQQQRPTIGWPDRMDNPAFQWLNANPHKFALARIGLFLQKADGAQALPGDLKAARQELQLWTGAIASYFELEGEPVRVWTRVHPDQDLVAVDIESPLIASGRLALDLRFPYPETGWAAADAADWTKPEQHQTTVGEETGRSLRLLRRLDETTYHAGVQSDQELSVERGEAHHFRLRPAAPGSSFAVSVAFSPDPLPASLPTPGESRAAAEQHWEAFWTGGGAIDFSGSIDPRARELERRIVLSQYLMAIQAAGSLPPQETGLTSNSWEGKFHLEMHWWHAAHFALWGRPELLERSMSWYLAHLPQAKALAASNGFQGAQWPKQVGPEGRESPGAINPFLLWQQPHVIYMPELLYRARRDSAVLHRYKDLVFETADFLASVVYRDEASGRYMIGPPVAPAQEVHHATETFNPTFELAYFQAALEAAQAWRERLGMPRNPAWDRVITHLSPLPVKDGRYEAVASNQDLWASAERPECAEGQAGSELIGNPCQNTDHPSFAGAFGMLPGAMADAETMRRTLHAVADRWNFQRTWGWDYPLLAMTAARLGEPERAVRFLLLDTPANRYGVAGHTRQYGFIFPYLPANGSLLMATAMMAAGWEGARGNAPGFPKDGAWQVRWEGLYPLP